MIFLDDFFYIVLIFAQNFDCRYTLEPPQGGGSNEYPHSMFWRKNKKKIYPCKPQFYYMSLVVRKPVFGVSDQVRHKPGCTVTEDG